MVLCDSRRFYSAVAIIPIFLMVLTVFPYQGYAQRENVWAFGNNAGLDFSTRPPSYLQTSMSTIKTSASVCDASGDLLFYTEGTAVWDRNHNLMPNGHNLIPLCFGDRWTTTLSEKGTIIIPIPDAPDLFYIMSLTSYACAPSEDGRLYYSLIDMRLNGGYGDVVAGQRGILIDSGLVSWMTGTGGGDCNLWLLSLSKGGDFKAYEISSDGTIAPPVITPLVDSFGIDLDSLGGSVDVSPNGRYVAFTGVRGGHISTIPPCGVLLCTFDRSTGLITSTCTIVGVGSQTTAGFGSVCFSPDNSKLYIGSRGNYSSAMSGLMLQYDISAGTSMDISATQTEIIDSIGEVMHFKRGPDQKIYYYTYLRSAYGYRWIGVIHKPNLSGVACSPDNSYLQLGVRLLSATGGFPNVVPVIGSYSDTLGRGYSDTLCFTPGELYLPDSATNIIWSDGSTGISLAIAASGIYSAQYNLPSTGQCVLYIDTFDITYVDRPGLLLDITPSCYNSANGAVTLSGGGLGDSYIWRDAAGTVLSEVDHAYALPSGTYELEITTPEGCTTRRSLVIPEVRYLASFLVDSVVCAGEALAFENSSDAHYSHFTWFYGNGDSSTLQSAIYRYAISSVYEATLIAKGDHCIDTVKKTIVVDEPAAIRGFRVDRDELCVGEAVQFELERGGEDRTVTALRWDFGDNSYIDHSKMIGQTLQHAFDTAGYFQVGLTAQYRACPDTRFEGFIQVHPFPEVELGTEGSLCMNAQPLYLKNLRAAPSAPYHQQWSTGDTSEGLKVVTPGTYSLTVTTDPIGCATTESITIDKDCYIDIPNAFTPNGDGHNDYFLPRPLLSESLIRFRMQIFNRLGALVFETSQLDGRGWDGRFNGEAQPMGVYLYQLEADFENGRQETYQGNITLIR